MYHKLFFHLVDATKEDEEEDDEGGLQDEAEQVGEEEEDAGEGQQEGEEEGFVVSPNLLGQVTQLHQVGVVDGKHDPHLSRSFHQSLKAGHFDSWRFLNVKI